MDIDDLFGGKGNGKGWRDTLSGESLKMIEAVEERILAGDRPTFSRVAARLTDMGVPISSGSVGTYFRRFASKAGLPW